jgi:GH35 family endo-1,4-beta-xylanase
MLTLPIILATVVVGQAAPPPNLFVNGSFANGIESWTGLDPASADAKVVTTTEPKVPRALQVTLRAKSDVPTWGVAVTQRVNVDLKRGEPVILSFWGRSETQNKVSAFLQQGQSPYTDSFREQVTLTPQWHQYAVEGVIANDYGKGETQAGLHLNFGPGTIQLGEFQLYRMPVEDRPTGPVSLISNGDFRGDISGTWDQRWVEGEVVPGGAPKGNAWRLTVQPKTGANPWDHSVGQVSTARIYPGDTVYFRALMRSPTRSRVGVMYEQATEPHTKYLSTLALLTPEWKEYKFAAAVAKGFAPGAAKLTLFLGYGPGTVEIADVRVENMGRTPLKDLAQTVDYYGGVTPSNSWRKAALERIERIRKGDLTIVVQGRNGKPVPGATVKVEQLRHAFKFGTAAPAALIAGTDATSEKFRSVLARNFNTVTFENDLKWNSLKPDYTAVDQAMKWLEANKFDVRGHNFVWGSYQYLPAGFKEMSDAELRETIRKRVFDAGARFRGKLYLWDVVNEAVSERELWERLGWDTFAQVFKWAREADPKAQLAYNDFNITEEAQAGRGHRDMVHDRINKLLSAGAPLDVIGIQAHVGVPMTPMDRVLEIYDEMGKYGKPLEITEYDLGVQDDKVNGEHMRDFVTAAFSHPKVQAFIMWGFWEGAHWRAQEGGAMYRRDWTPRPAALAWEDLVRRQWWTNASAKTGRNGQAKVRAFLGSHRITVNAKGKSYTLEVPVDGTSNRAVFMIP